MGHTDIMTTSRARRRTMLLAAVAVMPVLLASLPGSAASKAVLPHGARFTGHHAATSKRIARPSARAPKMVRSRGFQPMYTDGVGSAVGFHPGPFADDGPGPSGPPFGPMWRPYRGGGVRETMAIDVLTRSNGYAYGYPFP